MKDDGGGGSLKTATAVVGLLAGLVGGIYVLGGLVISLRLILFDHFSLQGAVTAVGQLPRESTIATALLNVLALAALIGLAAAMVYGIARRPRPRVVTPAPDRLAGETDAEYAERSGRIADRLLTGSKLWVVVLGLFFGLVSFGSVFVAWTEAKGADDGVSPPILPFLFTLGLTFGAVVLGWYLIRRAGRRAGWARAERALAAGGIWAGIAVIPLLMLAGTKPFETAQICLSGEPAPLKGKLIGEGSDKLFLEEEFGREASIVVLPAEQVSKREFGDLSSLFTCPLAPGQKLAVKKAEAGIGDHGSRRERALARELRPLLRFDSGERWRPVGVGPFLGEDRRGERVHLACWREAGAGGEDPWVRCGGAPDPEELRPRRGAPDFLEIDGTLTDPGSYQAPGACRRGTALDCNDGKTSVIYYRRTSHGGLWYWDYWWFFRFNDYNGSLNECRFYCADHEGDWEGMTVVTTPSVKKPKLVGAVYAAHKDRVLVPGTLVPRRGRHTLVFVARGTHASYPFSCSASSCDQFGSLVGFRLPEEGHDGTISWGGNVEADCFRFKCVKPLPDVRRTKQAALPLATGWAAWGGKWGSSCVRGCERAESSPNSPGAQTRFKCPWAPNREARLAPNGTVSRSDPAGDAERLLALCKAQRADF